jgi:hypothetical protein
MKILTAFISIVLVAVVSFAQSRSISKAEHDGAIQYAVSETNSLFPFVFTVVIENYVNGKVVSVETDVAERQAQGVERERKTLQKDGTTKNSYEIMTGFGSVYCSFDGKTWKGPQQYVCPGPDQQGTIRLYRPREPEKAEYSLETKVVNGSEVKIYREYLIFAPSTKNGRKDFRESVATIDQKGLFTTVFDTEGTLEPQIVTLTRTQTWKLNAKFDPVVAPKTPIDSVLPPDSDPVMKGSVTYAMPKSAIDAEIGGTVLLAMRAEDTGKPSKVVVATLPMWPCGENPKIALEDLFSTLKDTVMTARFSPAIEKGKPVAKDIGLEIQLKNPKVDFKPVDIDPLTGKRKAKQISGGILNGKALSLPKPSYPYEARANRDSGSVSVQVLIDEQGKVIRAGVVSGPATLQFASRESACGASIRQRHWPANR